MPRPNHRLAHLLARNLPCTRARARNLLAGGEVVDTSGRVLADPRATIDPRALPLPVTVSGRALTLHDAYHLALHKPAGYLSALEDRRHQVAYSLLREAPLFAELRPVGRLDLETTGLLLWTTDGAWLHALTHPRRRVPRTYQAALARPLVPLPPDLVLDDGHRPDITDLRALPSPASAHPGLARPAHAAVCASITIIGGAYHEVRRIFAALGNHVLGLCRVAFGHYTLPEDLAPGAFRPVERTDV